MSKLFLYLIKHEPNGKVLNNKEIGKLKKIFFVMKRILLQRD